MLGVLMRVGNLQTSSKKRKDSKPCNAPSYPFKINIIQLYAPTVDKKYDERVEALYDTIGKVISKTKSDEITLVMGDYNAKIGEGKRSDLVGEHGLGISNQTGDRLYEFCQEREMVIANTWFKLPKRRLYTWISPTEDNNGTPIRNQIDYILINKRFKNIIKRVTTYPGADIGSDHVPLIADLKLKLKATKQK
ncbi:craniofacial development protein 2-like [Centruroides sculpturatus]|uniref:craniofacial development protein 2-like n=1 Tax=Centruroides sculpturatus TaxID=218467 RepID=UPI000C6D80D6|nr:craniofacial development protein 2-like [Centruroides sculpturatus]